MASQDQNLNSNTGISFPELIDSSCISATLGLLTPWILLLLMMIWKRRKRENSLFNDGPERSKDRSSTVQQLLSQNFRKQMNFLHEVTYQISEDRKDIMESVFQEFSTVQDRILKYIDFRQSSIQEVVDSILQKSTKKNDKRASEIEKLLETLKSDITTLYDRFSQTSELKISSTGIETADDDQFAKVNTVDLLNCIVTEAKAYVEKLIAETKIKERETINSISRFLEQSQKDIQREVTIFSSVAQEEYVMEKSENTSLSLVSQVEEVEEKLLEGFLFLNRQRFEIDNLKKRLKYFNQKFHSTIVKFDTYWQESNATYNHAAQQLEESGRVCVSTAADMNNNTLRYMQKFETLKTILSDLHRVLKLQQEMFDWLPLVIDIKKTDGPSDCAQMSRLKNCNQMLQDILLITGNTSEHLQTVYQLSEKMESLDNQMKSMVNRYCSLLSSFKDSGTLQFFQGREISGDSLPLKDEPACLDIIPEIILKDIVEITLEYVGFLFAAESIAEASVQSKNKAQNSEFQFIEDWDVISSVSIDDNRCFSDDDLAQDFDKFHFTE